MNLEEIEVYRATMKIGESVWRIVNAWDYFATDTLGKQFVKAADSIAANISEGFGRFFYKENKQFNYYARGSLYETKTWLVKAHNRGLVGDAEYMELREALESVAIRLNNYIRSIGTRASAVHETAAEYVTQGEVNGACGASQGEVNGACGASQGEVNGACGASMGANAPSFMTNDAAQPPLTLQDDAPQVPMTSLYPMTSP